MIDGDRLASSHGFGRRGPLANQEAPPVILEPACLIQSRPSAVGSEEVTTPCLTGFCWPRWPAAGSYANERSLSAKLPGGGLQLSSGLPAAGCHLNHTMRPGR